MFMYKSLSVKSAGKDLIYLQGFELFKKKRYINIVIINI